MNKIILLFLMSIFIISCTNSIKWEEILNKQEINNQINQYLNELNIDEALILLKQNYINNPNDIENTLLYANILAFKWSTTYQEKQYATLAIEILTKLIEVNWWNNNRMDEVNRLMWYSYEIMEDYDNAIKNYELSIKLNKDNYMTYNHLGHAYKLLWENKKAKTFFKKSLSINPEFDHALLNMWNIYLLEKDIVNAKSNYEKVIEISKNKHFKSESYYTLWNIYFWEGDIIKARKMFQKANESNPNFDLPYIGMAKVDFLEFTKSLYEKWDSNEANIWLYKSSVTNIKKAIQINPNKTLAYYELAKQYKMFWEIENSIILFNKALEVLDNDITLSKTEKQWFKNEIEKSI